jgi:hypothetical protein
MDLFVDVCMEMQLREFIPQHLSNVINGEQQGFFVCRNATLTSGGCAYGSTGFAKFEARFKPAQTFMDLFVRTCVAMELQGFNPQNLANTINGEAAVKSVVIYPAACVLMTLMQALRSSAINRGPSSWSCS